ncbi:2-hydroxyacid dehydrogenase [Phenylobacterium sp.]|uniref:2-hydroxyacid dehydrogenase n=1 Tax=Phenylobacterium sp. TaxID=1871053 RepID=UPI00272F5DAC|nr:2-hydroxyacid dehydrogenase [Phenylobacterium sp.]MDP2212259.1 2-hydroxyacid dehydrogenase [Phenylobacterium sp.]
MRVAVFSARPYDQRFLSEANTAFGHELTYFDVHLSRETCRLAAGFEAVCVFVNDELDAELLQEMQGQGLRLVALRASGFNNVDVAAAKACGVAVCRVPAYSPHAVAEHTLALILTLNRKTHRAYNRVREGNFALDGLLGFDLKGKTAGVVGTGAIGEIVAEILQGFGCKVIASDPNPSAALQARGVVYRSVEDLLPDCDIVSLHCPLTPVTRHLIDGPAIARMKPGVMLINTSRGAVVDTVAVIAGLKSGAVGSLGLDVYEEEAGLFFEDRSARFIDDDVFARLLTFPNVLVTGHQAFFTHEALSAIAQITLANITDFERHGRATHEVSVEPAPARP